MVDPFEVVGAHGGCGLDVDRHHLSLPVLQDDVHLDPVPRPKVEQLDPLTRPLQLPRQLHCDEPLQQPTERGIRTPEADLVVAQPNQASIWLSICHSLSFVLPGVHFRSATLCLSFCRW